MHHFHYYTALIIFFLITLISFTCCFTTSNNHKLIKKSSDKHVYVPIHEKWFLNTIKESKTFSKMKQNVYEENTKNISTEVEESRQTKTNWFDFLENTNTMVGRTFGGLRRMKLAIPAIMYKLGVVTTMLGFLTLFTIKGVLIGIIILIIQLSAGLAKLATVKHENQGWDVEKENLWPGKVPQNIHVHVHGSQGHYSSHSHHPPSPPSHGFWDRDLNLNPSNSNLNLYASLTPYAAYSNNNMRNSNFNVNLSKLDEDLLNKIREYKELKALRELKESLYQQVI